MKQRCVLCQVELDDVEGSSLLVHPPREDCPNIQFTDSYGIAVDPEEESALEPEPGTPAVDFFEELDIRLFPFVEEALIQIFTSYGLPRLGGVSTGRGWSAFSTYQRCKHLFYRRYVEPIAQVSIMPALEHEARAVGTLIHAFLAVYYTRMIQHDYPLTPDLLRDELLKKANPALVDEGWRVFLAYSLYYQDEEIMPLAVEYDLRDPRTGESCRYDLVAFFPKAQSDRLPGTYILEHKSASRFDDDTLNGWANEGEVLGQVMLWKRLKLNLRYGELRGVIVNILGKHKEPKFHRTTVGPETWLSAQHARDLKYWEAQIALSRATNRWPHSRANCISRYGKCDLFDHCATNSEER